MTDRVLTRKGALVELAIVASAVLIVDMQRQLGARLHEAYGRILDRTGGD